MLAHVVAEFVGFRYILALWGPSIPESLELFELEIIGSFAHVRQPADLSPVYDGDGLFTPTKVVSQCIDQWHIDPKIGSKFQE